MLLKRFFGVGQRKGSVKFGRRLATTEGRRMQVALEALEPRHLLAAGALDPTFDVDGRFTHPSGIDGFQTGRSEEFRAVGQQSNGKLVYAGTTTAIGGGDGDIIVARLNVDGTLDSTFGSGGFVRIDPEGPSSQIAQDVFDLAIDGLDRIIVVGKTVIGTKDQVFALRLSAGGTHETEFDNNAADAFTGLAILTHAGGSSAHSVAIDGSGGIVVAGQTLTNGDRDILVGRFLPSGDVDSSFGTGGWTTTDVGDGNGDDIATDVAIDGSGNIVVTGSAFPNTGFRRMAVARYSANGSPDSSFGPSPASQNIKSTAVNVATVGSAAFNLGSSVSMSSNSLAVQGDGKIVIAGSAQIGVNLDVAVARLKSDGTLDTTGFNASSGAPGTLLIGFALVDVEDPVFRGPSLALQQNNTIVIGTSVGPDTASMQFGLARLLNSGILDGTFDADGKVITTFPGAFADQRIRDVLVQFDGRIVAAGSVRFTSTSPTDFQIASARYDSGQGTAPVAEAGGPYSVASGGSVMLDGTASLPGPSGSLAFTWDLDGDGIFGETGPFDAVRGDEVGATPTFQAVSLGTQNQVNVRLKVVNQTTLLSHFDVATINIATNAPPLIAVDNPFVNVDEGNLAANTGTFSDPDLDPVTLTASIGTVIDNGNGTWSWSFATSDGPLENQTVTITADDGEFQPFVTFDLTVQNVAPTANFENSNPVNEGGSATVNFSAQFDPSTADTTSGFLYSYDFENDGTFEIIDDSSATASVPAGLLADGPASVVVRGRIKDKDGGFNDLTTTITVNNVAPAADAGGPYETFFDEAIVLSGSASDAAGALDDPLTFEWDFDGNLATVEATGANPVFDPVALGITTTTTVTVTLSVTDKDGGVGTETAQVTVLGPGNALINGTLNVVGTSGGEPVVVRMQGGQLQVRSNSGSEFFDPNLVNLVKIHMGAGDDTAIIGANVTIDVHMDGGAGNDFLISGAGNDVLDGGPGNDLLWGRDGNDVLLGGEGNDDLFGGLGDDVLIGGGQEDQLFGGTGRDLLIGGINMDWLFGGAGDDILIGGTTSYDSYDAFGKAAIDEVMSIWTSSATYDQRVGTLTGSGGLLEAGQTVFNDDDSDVLVGGGGRDLYFADVNMNDGNADILLFASPFEDIQEL